jgi:hypothetical protein
MGGGQAPEREQHGKRTKERGKKTRRVCGTDKRWNFHRRHPSKHADLTGQNDAAKMTDFFVACTRFCKRVLPSCHPTTLPTPETRFRMTDYE